MQTVEQTNGLDELVKALEAGKVSSLAGSWTTWLERALTQLEHDDSIDAHFTDSLAETLDELDAALSEGYGTESTVNKLISLYHRQDSLHSVESRWRRRIARLGRVQIETGLWLDLEAALEAAANGQTAQVAFWLDEMCARFQNAWADYRQSNLLPSEISQESQAGHRLLGEGIQAWLRAFEFFRQGLERDAVLAQADRGQRCLVGLQVIQAESKDCLDHFRAAWAN